MQEEAKRAVSDSLCGFICANGRQGFKGRAKIKKAGITAGLVGKHLNMTQKQGFPKLT